MKKRLFHLFVALGFLAAALPARAGAEDEILIKYFDLTEGRVAFSYGVEGDKEKIYILDFATLVAKPVAITGGGNSTMPRFSPDGKKLAFVSDRSGTKEIYTSNADGSGLVQVTSGRAKNESPDWSPDGKKLTFSSVRNGTASDIYVANADGSGAEALTKASQQYTEPRWSPDGTAIMFVTNEYWPGTDLLSYKLATNKIEILTTGYTSASAPTFARSAKNIQYAYVYGPAEDPDIWTARLEGGKPYAIVTRKGHDLSPEWMDDGKNLLFLGEPKPGSGHWEIYLLDVKAKKVIQVTECQGTIRDLSWSPTSPEHLKPKAQATPIGDGPPISIPPPIPASTPAPATTPAQDSPKH